MLERARERIARDRLRHVELHEMDAARLTFAADAFDVVYAPYVMSVVPDPVRVALEMRRVCRPNGRIVLLNHFRSRHASVARVERAISPLTRYLGFRADLDLRALLAATRLTPLAIEKVNLPRIWSLVVCGN
jgi:phosphatidylethanolamine/phosphatidyl-N-methylethanolamine N-methyltransferase